MQSRMDNALYHIKTNEGDVTEIYAEMIEVAPLESNKQTIKEVLLVEEIHSGSMNLLNTGSSAMLINTTQIRWMRTTALRRRLFK